VTAGETPPEGRITLEIAEDIAILTLDRPAKLNALSLEMLGELEQHVAAIDRETGVRVVIVTGAGARAFCVGADINAWSALEPLDMWRRWIREGHRVLQRLASLRQPTIAAINGYAFGGGLELALAADLRIAADAATFAMPETTIGTLPGWAGTRRLPDLIGAARAKQLIFTGARIDAATAERWGLINELVPRVELMDRATTVASEIAANAPVSVQLAKAAIDDDNAALEALAGAITAGTEDGREGTAAFRAKRSARFTGH
jgi:enoyl-CoA hydratase/carnithine racemase